MDDRKYVVVCNRHDSNYGKSILLFWGCYSKDNEKRSFGGYNTDLNECEMYSLNDILSSGYNFKEYTPQCDWKKFDDFYIALEDLKDIGVIRTIVQRR